MPKFRDKALLHLSNRFVDAFPKIQISWQWQLHYVQYSRNHCFSVVWQPFNYHCLKMMMSLDWPYQNWGTTLYCTYQIDSWMHFEKIQTSWQAVALCKILYISLSFDCFSSFHWTLLKMMMNLDWLYQNWGTTLYCMCQIDLWMHFQKNQTSWQAVGLCKIL